MYWNGINWKKFKYLNKTSNFNNFVINKSELTLTHEEINRKEINRQWRSGNQMFSQI